MSECIPWWGKFMDDGYGYVYVKSVRRPAHRVIYEECFGPIPDGLFVLHHCDNPPCVNPEHLFLGTLKDNTQDMLAKRRGKIGWTHCGNGHEWTEASTYWFTHKDGRRQRMCRTCNAERVREYAARKAELK